MIYIISCFFALTNSNITKYGLNYGYNDIKFAFAYDQTNIYYMLEKKYEYFYLYRNDKLIHK